MQAELTAWLQAQGYGMPEAMESIGGGCINQVQRLHFATAPSLFLKQNAAPPAQLFQAEADGLQALARTRTLRVPEVLLIGADFLLLEDLGHAPQPANFWQQLGTGLAALHATVQPSFGFTADNYCGATLQINTPATDGWAFFGQQRICHLTRIAAARNLLDSNDQNALYDIADKLPTLVPEMPPVLIHGDLWSGNIHCDAAGQPALIDPACYWGWAEAELAMTVLFGGFAEAFYAAYAEQAQLAPDWRQRAPLYNLYHLLNHLLLFGSSYLPQIQQIYRRYARL